MNHMLKLLNLSYSILVNVGMVVFHFAAIIISFRDIFVQFNKVLSFFFVIFIFSPMMYAW